MEDQLEGKDYPTDSFPSDPMSIQGAVNGKHVNVSSYCRINLLTFIFSMVTWELITWKLNPLSCFSMFLMGRSLSKTGGRNFGEIGLASAAGGSAAFAGTDEAAGVTIGASVGLGSAAAAAGAGVEDGAVVFTVGETAGFTSSADVARNKNTAPLRAITRSREAVFMVGRTE